MESFRARLEESLAGQYRFIRELGGGGMSRTYLADEPALQRRVVVKVLAPEMLEGLSVERFKREVLMAASLQHPHVVPVLAAGDADGLPWFSMPYVDGDSLRQRLGQGALTIPEAVGVLRDVARALSYAHAQGIVHRDIKPDNVLLSAGSATVTDFGIAKAISASRTSAGGATLTQAGLAIGTPAYMAPEQAEGAVAVDHRADLYAFGAMAFELLTGQPVFSANTPGRLLVAHITEKPRDPRVLRADVPPALAELVLRCLEKAPSDRPADAAAIVRALEGSGASSSTTAPVLAPTIPLSTALGTWAGGTALLVGGVFIASRTVGVPTWAMPSAITLAAAGLPALLGTWWVQRTARRAITRTPTLTPGGSAVGPGTMATLALRAQPHVSFRRTRKAGIAVGGGFAALLAAFAVSRAYGIGPAASLIGAGEFGERESVMVADFRPPANDTTLGVTIAEALRTDLAQSPNLSVLTRAAVREVLQRMQRPTDAAVPFDVAREIATREGTKAVIDGDVVRLGGSYVLSARLVSATDGREMATFRATADGDATLVSAVGKLSRSIREKVGESLRGLQSAKAIERVSTPSLAALRKYVEGAQIEENGGDRAKAMKRLQEAVAIDTAFAMAWRKIAVMYNQLPNSEAEQIDAISRAYRHRDRLTDNERDVTEAGYFTYGPTPDPDRTIAAYEQLLARDSLNNIALNNLAVAYVQRRQLDRALAMYRRAAMLKRPPAVSVVNWSGIAARLQKPAVADSAAARFATLFPKSPLQWEVTSWQLYAHKLDDSLGRLVRTWMDTSQSPRLTFGAANYLRDLNAIGGRIDAALAMSVWRTNTVARLTRRPPAALQLALDSAVFIAKFDGDRARTHRTLQRMLTPAFYESTPPVSRPWSAAAVAAALVGDAEMTEALAAAYRRDNAERSADRVWEDARVAGLVALAHGQYQQAATLLKQAGQRRTAPDAEEAYLIAVAFDRAHQVDSATAWFARVVDPKWERDARGTGHLAGAHKRLGELLDAQGNVAGAIEHYDAFATLWKDAEPSRQPVVKAARDRID
ncbi:MAG: protein kinase [Gemmatimonadaceae bacterium]|nr:protein kinase [Gemmatimonadaceae bacterium]